MGAIEVSKHNNTRGGVRRTLLVINTGSIKKKFILQRLRELGHCVVMIHREKNWAHPYVDHWILTDTNDHARVLEDIDSFLAQHQEIKIDGAITFWEDDVQLTSKITDRFNLIGIPHRIAKRVRNKLLFRKFCVENNIYTPQFTAIKSARDLERVVASFSFPVVLKPSFGSGSVFVVKADDRDELYATYEYIKNNISIHTESALHDGLELLVEEYIDGDEVDLDMLLQHGKVKYCAVVDNAKTQEPFFIETQQTIPSRLPVVDQEALKEQAEVALEKLGIQNGCIHFEAKATRSGPVPIEINLRMGGDETYLFSKKAWGVDLIEGAVMIACGDFVEKVKLPDNPRTYLKSNTFTPENSGLLARMNVDEKVYRVQGLEELCLFKKAGDAVLVPPEGYEYLGWMVVSGDHPIDTEDNFHEVLKHIHCEVAKFDRTSSIGKTTRKTRFSMATANKSLLVGAAKIERIRRVAIRNQRKLHVGIAYNHPTGELEAHEIFTATTGTRIEEALRDRGYQTTLIDFNDYERALTELRENNIDIVFNAVEQVNVSRLQKAHAAALFDILQIPYTGSDPTTLRVCQDKIHVKKLLTFHEIPTPRWDCVYTLDDTIDPQLRYPLIVKPATTDNSIGISNSSVVTNRELLRQQIAITMEAWRCPVLVEEYIPGDEYHVSIIGSEEADARVLPLSRSMFDKLPPEYWHLYTYDAKWGRDTTYGVIQVEEPAKSSNKKLESLITEIALDTYSMLDCRDYGVVEIKVDVHDNPYVLELNPNQHMHPEGYLPRAARLAGMDFGDFIEEILRLTIKRYEQLG